MNIFENLNYDFEELEKDLKDIENNSNFVDDVDLMDGIYEVELANIEVKQSTKGKKYIRFVLKVLSGEHENKNIKYDQYILFDDNGKIKPFTLKLACDFLRSLDSSVKIDSKNLLTNTDDLLSLVLDEKFGSEYKLGITTNQNNNAFRNYRIIK